MAAGVGTDVPVRPAVQEQRLRLQQVTMHPSILELAKQAGLKKEHGADREYIGDFDWRLFSDLMVKDIMVVVAAHALSGDSAVDVFANLKRIYES